MFTIDAVNITNLLTVEAIIFKSGIQMLQQVHMPKVAICHSNLYNLSPLL